MTRRDDLLLQLAEGVGLVIVVLIIGGGALLVALVLRLLGWLP